MPVVRFLVDPADLPGLCGRPGVAGPFRVLERGRNPAAARRKVARVLRRDGPASCRSDVVVATPIAAFATDPGRSYAWSDGVVAAHLAAVGTAALRAAAHDREEPA